MCGLSSCACVTKCGIGEDAGKLENERGDKKREGGEERATLDKGAQESGGQGCSVHGCCVVLLSVCARAKDLSSPRQPRRTYAWLTNGAFRQTCRWERNFLIRPSSSGSLKTWRKHGRKTEQAGQKTKACAFKEDTEGQGQGGRAHRMSWVGISW
eukprot:306896-Pleurochrysis_carterae.AAC.1